MTENLQDSLSGFIDILGNVILYGFSFLGIAIVLVILFIYHLDKY